MDELKNLIRQLDDSGETIIGWKSVPTVIRGVNTIELTTFGGIYHVYSHQAAASKEAEVAVFVAIQNHYDDYHTGNISRVKG